MDAILIISLILFLAFFQGIEAAFVTANKLRIELDHKQDVFGSGIIKFLANHPGEFISSMVTGNIITLVIYGLVSYSLLNPFLAPFFDSSAIQVIINILISILLLLLIIDFLAKTLFNIAPNFILKLLSIPALIFFYILYPLSKLMIFLSGLFLKPFFRSDQAVKVYGNQIYSQTDLDYFIGLSDTDEADQEPLNDNIRIFQNALDFSQVKLRECMIPRTEIDAVDIDTPIADLKALFIETQHSRLLIYKNSIDNVMGYFDLKDIFKLPVDIKTYIRKVIVVPETMAANKLLKMFVEQKKNVALVVDEFGGTSGLVTIEDVLEEIVGDIEDEHDINELTEKVISKNEYIFSGRLEIDYLNEKYNFNLPEEDDYKTLAGLILYYHGSIPANNDVIKFKNIVIKVMRTTTTKVEIVNLHIS